MTFDFDIACPKCGALLHAKNEWIGKAARCNTCRHQLTIAREGGDATPPAYNNMAAASEWHYAKEGRQCGPLSASDIENLIASGTLKPSDLVWRQGMGSWSSVQEAFISRRSADGSAGPRQRVSILPPWNWADMVSGKEKEDVFQLVPGEKVLDGFTVRHQHFLIVRRGITRVTLTTHRVLYTATRVFSPAYWLLVTVFPPLILYYVFRISLNRNVSVPLSSIDSVEKRYRPNWLLFILATLAAYLLAGLCTFAAMLMGNAVLAWAARILTFGLAGPALLVLLLKTRVPGIDVGSDNNQFSVQLGASDAGVSEARIDTFIERLCAQVHRAKAFQQQVEYSPP